MKKSVKKIIAASALILLLGILAACGSANESETEQSITEESVSEAESVSTSVETESETAQETTTAAAEETTNTSADVTEEMPAPFEYSDSDENDGFYLPLIRCINNIPVELANLRDETEVNNWINSFASISAAAPSSITEYANIYSFISYFDISREEAESALKNYLDPDDGQIRITDEEFNAFFSDEETVTKKFTSDYSIVIGDKIYCPNWIYTHSADDYAKAGITKEMIIEKSPLYSDFYLTQAACTAFSEKLSDFTGKTISIEPAIAEKTSVEEIEDTAEDVFDEYEVIDEVAVEE